MMDRRAVLAGGAALGGAALWSAHVAWPEATPTRVALSSPSLRLGYAKALEGVLARWWDPRRQAIRATDGGAVKPRTGRADPALSVPSFWQMECLENALFNDSRLDPAGGSRERLVQQWSYIVAGVPAFTPRVLAGDGRDLTINLSDDAAWQCWYLMHVHIATGDTRALAYLAEATAFTRRRFADRDAAANPLISLGRTPAGQPITTNRNGILYAVEGERFAANFGKISTSYEAILALTELYVYQQLGMPAYRDCAINTFRWIHRRLRTPSPEAAAEATGQPVASRKAEGLYETELCLSRDGRVPADPHAGLLSPVCAFYGKPIRSLDSTYLNGAMAMALLATRLAALPQTGAADRRAYRAEAVHIANVLPQDNAYGRMVDGKRLIANTRDPWSEAHVAFPFAQEVLALPGVDAGVRQAFADTAAHILASADGPLSADWAGPELNFTTGRTTWEADYAASPGDQAGSAQIMTEGQTLAMIQAGIVAAELQLALASTDDRLVQSWPGETAHKRSVAASRRA